MSPDRLAAASPQYSVPFGSTSGERLTMARALALLFSAGGALVVLTILLPHAANTEDAGIAVTGALAVLVGGLLGTRGARVISVRGLQLLLALGAVLITCCVVFGGDSASAYPFMYLWVSLYAYYFFDARIAAVLIAWCAALYAAAFALGDNTPVPGVHWLMATGTIVVGGVLIGRLTAAIRAQAADLVTVSRMAGGLSGVDDFAQETCESLRASSGGDVVIFLELAPGGDGLQVTAMAGPSDAGMIFADEQARLGLERAFRSAEPVELMAGEPARGLLRRFDGHVAGLAQPVLRDGAAAAVLAVAWTTPRRALPERMTTSALLFAAEASLAMDRVERASQDRERQALEINDNIVQGLVVAKYSAQRGDSDGAIRAIDETLDRARRLITDQLQFVSQGRGGTVRPGDLARRAGANVDTAASPAPVAGADRD